MTDKASISTAKLWIERFGFYIFPLGISALATAQVVDYYDLDRLSGLVVWGIMYSLLIAPRVNNWAKEG